MLQPIFKNLNQSKFSNLGAKKKILKTQQKILLQSETKNIYQKTAIFVIIKLKNYQMSRL